jgi:hypothetical protein
MLPAQLQRSRAAMSVQLQACTLVTAGGCTVHMAMAALIRAVGLDAVGKNGC